MQKPRITKFAEARKVLKTYDRKIFKIKNVNSTSISFKDGQWRLEIGVSQRLSEHDKLLNPNINIKGLPVDFEEIGEIVAAILRTDKWRPAPPGVSMGHKNITAGTFGCTCFKNSSGVKYILSNNHVLAKSNAGEIGDNILQPGAADGGINPDDRIGTLAEFVTIAWDNPLNPNLVDCAIALPDDANDLLDELLELAYPEGSKAAAVDMSVAKSGRTTAVTQGTIVGFSGLVKVNYYVADDSGTKIWNNTASYVRDLYNLPSHTTESGTITSVKFYFRVFASGTGSTGYFKPSQKSGGTITDGTEQTKTASVTWATKSQTYTLNPATGQPYTWDEIDSLQIGIQLKSNTGMAYCTQVYIEITYGSGYILVLNPNATGDEESIPYSTSGAGLHWQDVDDVSLYGWFDDQIISQAAMASGGDSGSVLIDVGDNKAVGLCFAVSTSYSYFNRMVEVVSALGISIFPYVVVPTTLALTQTFYTPILGPVVTPTTLALTQTFYTPILGLVVTPTTLALALTGYAPFAGLLRIIKIASTLSVDLTIASTLSTDLEIVSSLEGG